MKWMILGWVLSGIRMLGGGTGGPKLGGDRDVSSHQVGNPKSRPDCRRLAPLGPDLRRHDGDSSDTFTQDFEKRLTAATVNGSETTYAYDGAGRRVSRTAGGTTTT